MDLKTLMETSPEDLAELQYNELKNHTIGILEQVKKQLYDDDFEQVKNNLVYSPAGDGYGSDNYFIDFSYSPQKGTNYSLDLMDIIDQLIRLNDIINPLINSEN